AAIDIGEVARGRRAPSEHSPTQQNFGGDLMRSQQIEPPLLEKLAHVREQMVVAAAKGTANARQQKQRIPVEPQLANREPRELSDKDDVAASLRLHGAAQLPKFSQRNPAMWISLN